MKKPIRDVMAVLSGDIGSRIVGFFVTVYLARVLAPASFGLINIGLAVLGYLALAGSPGIQMVETRNAAAIEGGLPRRTGAVLALRFALAPVLIALTWVITLFGVPAAPTRIVILLYALSLFPMALSLDWLFQGKEEFRRVAASRLLNALVFALGVILLVHADAEITWTPIAWLAGNTASTLLLGVLYIRQFGIPSMQWNLSSWKPILAENVPVGGAMFLAQSVTNLPPIVIGIFLSNADAGVYSAAMKLVFFLLILDRTLNIVFLPAATRCAVREPSRYPAMLAISLRAVLVFIVPSLITACILAPLAFRIVFGPGYEGGVPLFCALTGYVLITILNSLLVCTLIAFGRSQTYSSIITRGAVCLCIAVIALTPVLGTQGATIGVLIGEGVTLWLLLRSVTTIVMLPHLRSLLRPVIAGIAMAGGAVALSGVPAYIQLGLSCLVFVFVLLLCGGFSREDIRDLRERLI
ncbi:MAG TPA: oligosaccharide flippase family protein [Bacteroidota bacterium]|nr:oligosaccharide flippase family protein [Bacteroidota bacterium]